MSRKEDEKILQTKNYIFFWKVSLDSLEFSRCVRVCARAFRESEKCVCVCEKVTECVCVCVWTDSVSQHCSASVS